jgi:hypothetical protein
MKRLTIIFLLASVPAIAGEVYRCGQSYSNDPTCAGGQATRLHTPDAAAAPVAVPPAAASARPAAAPLQPVFSAAVRPPAQFAKAANSPTIGVYYISINQPRDVSTAEMDSIISSAAAAWSSGCNVNVRYLGASSTPLPAGVPIMWLPNFMKTLTHPADGATEICGTGGSRIELNPKRECASLRTITHELGHVLGIGHIHDDPNSVMSYLGRASRPNASDYASCNLAMKARYGVDYLPPENATASKTTDAEALRQRK